MHDLADFIVVGGGTAGCVLAAGLSTRADVRVTLVEAGDAPRSPFVGIPAGFSKLFGSRCDWAFSTTPQTPSGRSIFTPRGRMLGGSSALNAQIHQWGHPADFDGWRSAGADSWGWDDVAPVFRRMEQMRPMSPSRGTEGAQPVEPLADPQPQSRAFVEAVRRGFHHSVDSYNGGAFEGAWVSEVNHRHGRRVSAYDAWLKPVLRRDNLQLIKDALVRSIQFDGRRATGVEILGPSGEQRLQARLGVILCAGAFGSPHLLMASGIGPGAHLAAHGLPVVHDAPGVGANLHDHPMACLTFEARSRRSLKSAESPANLIRYLLQRRGMLASNVAEAIAFLKTEHAPEPAPDLELLFAPVEWRDEGLKPPRVHAFTIAVIDLIPHSRGNLRLSGPDMRTPPRIDPALLSDPAGMDRRTMRAGVDIARRVARMPPLAPEAGLELAPGAACANDEDIQSWLYDAVQTVYHPAGTCRMGADAESVVDSRLRVRGVDNLWVADASVMPRVTRGHPNAAVAMIADRAAKFIVADGLA